MMNKSHSITSDLNVLDLKLLLMDVDGTLTDGKLYIGRKGEVFKAFNVKDGCGIKDILPTLGILPVVITARISEIVMNRCQELGIELCFQGVQDKKEKLIELCSEFGYQPNIEGVYEEVAYIGDDIIDIPIMQISAIRACPANASNKVKNIANWVSHIDGGDGAVREFIDWLCDQREIINRRSSWRSY